MGNMHEYFVKGRDFNIQKLIILIFSIGGAYIISLLMNWFSDKLGVNLWWVEIPSILGVYSLLEFAIDKVLWSKFYRIPSFDGTWKGYLKSSIDNFSSEIPVTCIIKQNSKLICIIFEMEKSTSYSTSATIDVTKINGVTLEYDYINIPKIDQKELLNVHLGSNTFKLNGNALEGEYYNNQRATSGKIYLEKEGEN
jgi:hypothetical protein